MLLILVRNHGPDSSFLTLCREWLYFEPCAASCCSMVTVPRGEMQPLLGPQCDPTLRWAFHIFLPKTNTPNFTNMWKTVSCINTSNLLWSSRMDFEAIPNCFHLQYVGSVCRALLARAKQLSSRLALKALFQRLQP